MSESTQTEKKALAAHGTQDVLLTPSSIVATARADMVRKASNVDGPPYERYAFHRRHLKNAQCPADILRAALKDIGVEKHAKKMLSKASLIYLTKNPAVLEAAISLAEATTN